MKDFLGKELAIGDKVICENTGVYKGLHKAVVVKFTPQMVRVEFLNGSTALKDSTSLVKMDY